MPCKGNIYKRWSPGGCARKATVAKQAELFRQAEPVIVEGKEMKIRLGNGAIVKARRSKDGSLVTEPQPPERKKGKK